MSKRSIQINKLCLSAMFMAIGWLMPLITGQIPEFGNMLCPMHIPVLIAGFVLGPLYGSMVGFLLPLTRFFIFGMPVLYPIGIGMMFELATYGCISGLAYRLFHRKFHISDIVCIYISLLLAMLLGRFVWGVTRAICGLFPNNHFTWALFLSGAFVTAWPGIVLQIFLIPAIILCLSRANLLKNFMDFDIISTKKNLVKQLKEKITQKEGTFVIAIDGMSASGKTTLAAFLSKSLDANIISMDDFYLPKARRCEDFQKTPGSHMDFERLKEVLNLIPSQKISYQKFDCKTQTYLKPIGYSAKKVWIVEGSYSLHPNLDHYYDFAIFKKVSIEKQQKRLQKRNPNQYDEFISTWVPLENAYFELYQIENKCDVVEK